MSDSSLAEKIRVPSGAASSSTAPVVGEGEDVLAERDDVAVVQDLVARDLVAVEQGAVLAAEVDHHEADADAADLRVMAGEPLVGQEDVAFARAADGDAVLREWEALLPALRALDRDLGHRVCQPASALRRFTAKYPLRTRTCASLRFTRRTSIVRHSAVRRLLRRVGQQVVVVQLVGDRPRRP